MIANHQDLGHHDSHWEVTWENTPIDITEGDNAHVSYQPKKKQP